MCVCFSFRLGPTQELCSKIGKKVRPFEGLTCKLIPSHGLILIYNKFPVRQVCELFLSVIWDTSPGFVTHDNGLFI